jgi:hypothetical protein
VFEVRLDEVGGVVAEVQQVIPRLTLTATYGERMGGSKAQHAPAPVSVDAVSSLDELQRFLINTALRIATTNNPLHGRGSGDVADYLAGNMHRLKTLSNAHDLMTQHDKLVRTCQHAAQLLEHKQFAGTCQTDDCGADLFTASGSNHARCGTCGTEYEAIQEWRNGAKEYARAQDDNTVGYPDALSQRLNRVHGIDIGADYIRVLASRGILTRANPERGQDGKKLRAMYRLGDIKQILNGSRAA